MSSPIAVVLAAGKGTRMATDLPKVLVPVGGKPMIRHVLQALRTGGVSNMLVVVGYRADLVRRELADEPDVEFVEQTEQLGTGHAVMVCRERLADQPGPVLVVAGDSPMMQSASVAALLAEFAERQPACLLGTATKADPTGLGRVVRDDQGEFLKIVEEKDATPLERSVQEVNMSTYVFDRRALLLALEQLTTNNVQGEYYVTDCPGILKSQGKQVLALNALQPCEALSINTLDELAAVEQEFQRQRNQGGR